MRYIVKSSSGDFGEVRVLAEDARDALRIAQDMAERDARAVSIIDADGVVREPDSFERFLEAQGDAAEPPAGRKHG